MVLGICRIILFTAHRCRPLYDNTSDFLSSFWVKRFWHMVFQNLLYPLSRALIERFLPLLLPDRKSIPFKEVGVPFIAAVIAGMDMAEVGSLAANRTDDIQGKGLAGHFNIACERFYPPRDVIADGQLGQRERKVRIPGSRGRG